MIQIVFSAFQRIDELPDDKKRRVAGIVAVSYTHLDVYKRQGRCSGRAAVLWRRRGFLRRVGCEFQRSVAGQHAQSNGPRLRGGGFPLLFDDR